MKARRHEGEATKRGSKEATEGRRAEGWGRKCPVERSCPTAGRGKPNPPSLLGLVVTHILAALGGRRPACGVAPSVVGGGLGGSRATNRSLSIEC